jgi:hypothetical protein
MGSQYQGDYQYPDLTRLSPNHNLLSGRQVKGRIRSKMEATGNNESFLAWPVSGKRLGGFEKVWLLWGIGYHGAQNVR